MIIADGISGQPIGVHFGQCLVIACDISFLSIVVFAPVLTVKLRYCQLRVVVDHFPLLGVISVGFCCLQCMAFVF